MKNQRPTDDQGPSSLAETSDTTWHTAEELIATIRRSERAFRADFEDQFPEDARKQAIRAQWQQVMVTLEKELLHLALSVAEDTREPEPRSGESHRALLVRNVHVRMKQLSWSALVDAGGLVLGIVAMGAGDIVSGTMGSAFSIADLVRNIHQSLSRLDKDQVELYRATATLEQERRTKGLDPPFPTENEVVDSVIDQTAVRDESKRASLAAQLSSMIGDSIVSKGDGRVAVY